MNFLLNVSADSIEKLSMKDATMQGLQMLLMGMGVVFAVLLVICLLLLCFRAVVGSATSSGKAKKPENKQEAIVEPVATYTPSDDELVAVIAAAIAAANADSPDKKFRVVSFKRVRQNRR